MIVLMINERQAVQIALGHELVHALRTMNGNRKRNETGSYLYYDNGYKVRQEELDTIELIILDKMVHMQMHQNGILQKIH